MIETIIEKYGMNEQSWMEKFRKDLLEKIERERDLFFSLADYAYEREDNDEVRKREDRGDKEFNYKKSVYTLLQKLSFMNKEERLNVMWAVKNGIKYTINGIYVYGLKDNFKGVLAPLFADFALGPLKYL